MNHIRVSAAVTLPDGSTRTVGVTLGERPTKLRRGT